MIVHAGRIATPCRRCATSGARRLAATSTATATATPAASAIQALKQRVAALGLSQRFGNRHFAFGLGGGLLMAGLHSATGSANDFYDYRFTTEQDPDNIAGFYGGEELMELFCVFPLVNQIMMRLATFDDTGRISTYGVPGTLHVDMTFSDEANDATGLTDWFNKRERFKDTLFGYTCWDLVINYGFRTLEDGTRECYHCGEYFHGNLPVISQVMLLVFKIQARWMAWATEHHVNHFAFAPDAESEDWRAVRAEEEAAAAEHDSRQNMPMFLLRKYAISDLLAMLFGYYDKTKEPSFLVREHAGDPQDDRLWEAVSHQSEKEAAGGDQHKFPLWQLARGSSDAEEDTQLGLGWGQEALDREERHKLPFRRKEVQIQISEDIAAGERLMQQLLAQNKAASPEDVHAVMVRRSTLARRQTSALRARQRGEEAIATELEEDEEAVRKSPYQMATDMALQRGATRRMTRQATRRLTQGMVAGPGAIAAMAKANFDKEKDQEVGGEVPLATSSMQNEAEGEDASSAAV